MSNYLSIEQLYKLYVSSNYSISTDTRKLAPKSIFFALKGDKFDANTFAQESLQQGCSYAIVDDQKFATTNTIFLVENVLETLQNLAKYHRTKLAIPFIGITGSNGKTTNKELIHAVLSKKYKTLATKGNLNNHIGVPLTILSITPDYEMAIIEMGANHQGEIEMLSNIANPDYGIITNIGKAHLEGFGGEEGVKKGKSELFKHIKQKNGKVFLNTDDEVVSELALGIEAITYGEKTTNTIFGKQYKHSEFVEFKWATTNGDIENTELLKTHLFGHYNYINALCAACVGNYFKVGEKQINEALESYVPEMNRSQVKKTERNTLILDAYNANPSSMALAIDNFCKDNLENKFLVLGDMLELGEYSEAEHLAIITKVKVLPKIKVFFVGELFFKLKLNVDNFVFHKNVDDLIEFLKATPISQKTLLIKGSRGIKLEKIEAYV